MKHPLASDDGHDPFEAERERGEKFRLARKRLTYEQRTYCPHDGRLLAAVVEGSEVAEPGRWLWIVGGHVGQTAEMRESYLDGAEWAEREAERHDAEGRRHLAAFRLRWAAGLRSHGGGLGKGRDVPSLAYSMHDESSIEYDAPCRACHRDTRVTLENGRLRLGPASL